MAERTPRPKRSIEIHVGALRQRLGQRISIDVDMVFDGLSVISSRSSSEPVVGKIWLESIERGVAVTGTIRYRWDGECRRCLDPVSGEEEATIAEIFQVGATGEDDLIDFDGEHVELAPIISDTVATGLPLAPLCGPECRGPDPDRYPAVTAEAAERAAAEAPPTPDPRWAALSDLDLRD